MLGAQRSGRQDVETRAPPGYLRGMASDEVTIYSAGACLGNPGRGGYGTVLLAGEHRKELQQGYRRTTNNRMELLGAIVGLEALSRACSVDLYSDSTYVVNAMSKGWLAGWQKRGWPIIRSATDTYVFVSECRRPTGKA